MKKSTLNINHFGSAITSLMIALLFFSACRPSHKEEVDRLNNLSYAYHYRNLDSAKVYAEKALRLSDDYGIGYAEAYNNLAFVEMAKMNYQAAQKWLDLVEEKQQPTGASHCRCATHAYLSTRISQQGFLYLS